MATIIFFFCIFHVVYSLGSHLPKKVQIHVPHNIQHHHHTHTKYHFITVPVIRTLNETTTTTARPPIVMPVLPMMPLMPGLIANATTTTTTTPAPVPMAQPIFFNADYELIDMFNRRRSEKLVQSPPMKFRTVINVQETKKIPLSELFNLNNLLKKDAPRRIKIEVIPEKTKPSFDWTSLHDQQRPDNLEYDPDTAAYQSRMETIAEKPEWTAVRHLLEKHIRQDFPGLDIQTEIKQINERADTRPTHIETMDLKHIGYILIDDKDEKHFVPLDDPINNPQT